jgi:malate synthase
MTSKSKRAKATVSLTQALDPAHADILGGDVLEFIGALASAFGSRVDDLLARRTERQKAITNGAMPDFLPETREIRAGNWKVGPIPSDLLDRRVEITGPTDRKMIINALNSGARVFMADCEDSMTPTWHNVVQGQVNLRDAVNCTIALESAGKKYRLNEKTATLIVRPRGWHLPEKHILCDGRPVPGALVDYGLFLFHNAKALKKRGTGPYFYLPKLESHLEARLWNDVFQFSERHGVVDAGEIKVTVLIETILAAFEIDEILYELRDYIVGQNCGRWDYIFSFIKKFHAYPEFVLPDRAEVTMTTHFLRSYSHLVIRSCHRRGALAIGGMAAQIPIGRHYQRASRRKREPTTARGR